MSEGRTSRGLRMTVAIVGGTVQVLSGIGAVAAVVLLAFEGATGRMLTVAALSVPAGVVGYAVVRRAGYTGRHVIRGLLDVLSLP